MLMSTWPTSVFGGPLLTLSISCLETHWHQLLSNGVHSVSSPSQSGKEYVQVVCFVNETIGFAKTKDMALRFIEWESKSRAGSMEIKTTLMIAIGPT